MKAYGGVGAQIHIFLISELVGGERSASRYWCFTLGTYWIGGWVDPRVGLEYVEKRKFLTLPGLELRPLGRPARSQSLYRVRYLESYFEMYILLAILYDTEYNFHICNYHKKEHFNL
jgi:hypothetical protein